jgi:hypothetical protein
MTFGSEGTGKPSGTSAGSTTSVSRSVAVITVNASTSAKTSLFKIDHIQLATGLDPELGRLGFAEGKNLALLGSEI